MGWYADYKIRVQLKNIPTDEQVVKWLTEMKSIRAYHYADKVIHVGKHFNFFCGYENLSITRDKNFLVVETTVKYGESPEFLAELIEAVLVDDYIVMIDENRSSVMKKWTEKQIVLCDCVGYIDDPDLEVDPCPQN